MEPILVVHGGAGSKIRHQEERRKYLGESLEKGFITLKGGGSALDATIEAVKVMEDSPFFNAGTGSYPNLECEVEMDASIMTGDGLFGAVAAIRNVRYPVVVARQVAEETDHIFLAGQGANRFAELMGHKHYNPLTEERIELYKKKKSSKYFTNLEKMRKLYGSDTVGAVAIDRKGGMAAALSTGGIFLNLPGRVGDTPIIGGGIYASSRGATTATGHGEGIMKNLVAKEADQLLKEHNAEYTAEYLVKNIDADFGLIIIDEKGKVGIAYNTEMMSWGIKTESFKKVEPA